VYRVSKDFKAILELMVFKVTMGQQVLRVVRETKVSKVMRAQQDQ
jgi:hypothetical protein